MLYIVVVNVVTVVVVVVVNKVVTSPEIPQCYKKIRVYIYFFILYSSSNQEIASAVIYT